jgi:beta-N-acetylhexosaminidase
MPANKLSLEASLYPLLISRLDGDRVGEAPYESRILELTAKGIGGFIVFGGRKEEVKSFVRKVQGLAETPLFIASDIERGVAQQVSGYTPFPCQMAAAAAIERDGPDDMVLLSNAVKTVIYEAKDAGINMPLIPVLDVNQDPDNPIICTRAFSDSPETTAWFGDAYIRLLEEAGLFSCAKHFPGHGDTSKDSHIQLPVIKKSFEALAKTDLAPFKKAIEAGVSCVMVGHLVVSAVDAGPASLSEKIINGLLREELGFEGLVLTDALNMHALKGIENVPARSLKAGADILLHPDDPDLTVRELVSSLKSKEISGEDIEAASFRISRAKKKIREIGTEAIDWRRHRELSAEITERSITLVKDTPGILPLSGRDKVSAVFAGDEKYFKSSPLNSLCESIAHSKKPMLPPVASAEEIRVFAVFTSVSAWKGSSGIDKAEQERINRSIREAGRSVVISFGSPYILRHFRDADVLIAAYEPTEQAQNAVIRCLGGSLKFQGRLPVRLDI